MTPEQWHRVKEVFEAALGHAPEERSAFLGQACGADDLLRSEVKSLLSSYEKSFMETPAAAIAAQSLVKEESAALVGQELGHYQIIREIGRGGMGVVYLAQDVSLGRPVALKLLPKHLTSDPNRLRRFEREARAASALNQLNGIASFLGGTPLDVGSGANTAGLAARNSAQRPNLVSGVPVYLHDPSDPLQYLNPAAFSLPEIGQFGSLGRASTRGPSSKNLDLSVVKNWRMHDRYSLQFRAEMFNAFNHANFNSIDAGLSLNNVAGDENFGKPLNPNFGRITATRGPREIQFGLKFNF